MCRAKRLTNKGATNRGDNTKSAPPKVMRLEESLEDEEFIEVTPKKIRPRERLFDEYERKRAKEKAAAVSARRWAPAGHGRPRPQGVLSLDGVALARHTP